MLTKNEILFLKDLHVKKNRDAHALFICEGEKLIREVLNTNWEIQNLYATPDANESILKQFPSYQEISHKDLERISLLQSPNQFFAVVKQKKYEFENINTSAEFILVLDKINDPGNLGTIIRTADWFGVSQIICADQSVDLYNPKTIQSAMGSVFHIPVYYGELSTCLHQLKKENYKILAGEMQGENALNIQFPNKTVLLMGSESHGISSNLRSLIDTSVTIPRFGEAESLNVAVATAVLLAHFRS